MSTGAEGVHAKVQERYALAASRGGCCSGGACCASDYSPDELARIPAESILRLGSGNPVRAAGLQPGEVIVDLGSGAGIDVFLAASYVGVHGRAIGVDMTPAMVERARHAARVRGVKNASFVLAPIERMPLADGTADVVLSNCVINLSPDKPAVFAEAFRILKPGGRLVVSDVVQERDLGTIDDECGCVATAMVRSEYLNTIRHAGFPELRITEDRPWRTGPDGLEASAVTVIARKREEEVKS
jgi:arsenite methyltransferase